MPMIWIPEEELQALQQVFRTAEEINWEAYDRARTYILNPIRTPLPESSTPESCAA